MPRGSSSDDLVPAGLGETDQGVNADVLRVKRAFDAAKKQMSREELEHWSRKVYPVTSWALAGFSVAEVQEMTRAVVREK